MASKVAIMTDSTSSLPAHVIKGLPIQTIPMHVIFGEDMYLDGVDIQPAEFYTRLSTSPVTPTTSQPTPAAFIQRYTALLDQGYDVLSIHVSSKLSGTVDSATQAKNTIGSDRIHVYDSLLTSMAMGFQVLAVARAAAQGATMTDCLDILHRTAPKISIAFVVNTLEFLHRGGRIGGAARFFGTALDLKPVLELRDGKIEAIGRVRTMAKAIDSLLTTIEKKVDGHQNLYVSSIHAQASDECQSLLERAVARLGADRITESFCAEVSPVIGTHTGPGTLGLTFMAGL